MDRQSKGLSPETAPRAGAEPAPATSLPALPSPGLRPELSARLARVEASRERLRTTFAELRDETGSKLDWKRWVKRRPLSAVGIAAGAGFLAGGLVAGTRRRAAERATSRGAAVTAGLGAFVGSAVLSHLAPLLVDRVLDVLLRFLERHREAGRPSDSAASGREQPID